MRQDNKNLPASKFFSLRPSLSSRLTGIALCQVVAVASWLAMPFSLALADQPANQMKVEIIGAESRDKDGEQVLAEFKKFMQALGEGDLKAIGECLSPNIISTDLRTHKLFTGKEQVLEQIDKKILNRSSNCVIKSIVVYNPFVSVNGDTAMVSFRAVKEIGGDNPIKMESLCSEIYERKDSQWKVLNFQSSWKPLKSK